MATRTSTNIHLVADANGSGECTRCSEPATHVCGRCGDFYCSIGCQRLDWQSHRHVCIELPNLMSANMFYASRDGNAENDTITPKGPPRNIDCPAASTSTPPSTSSPAFKAKPSFNGSSGSTSSPASTSSAGSNCSPSSPPASIAALKKAIKPQGKDDGEPVKSWRQKPAEKPQQPQQTNYTMPTVSAGRGRGFLLSSCLGLNAPIARNGGTLIVSDSGLRSGNPFSGERRQDTPDSKEFRPKEVRLGNPFTGERRQDTPNSKEFRPKEVRLGNPFTGERRQDTPNSKEFRPEEVRLGNPFAGERRQDTPKSTEQDDITVSPPSAIKSGDHVILTEFHSTNRVYVCTEASQLAHQKVRHDLMQFLEKNVLKRLEQRPKLNAFVLVRSEMGQYTRGRVVATNTGASSDDGNTPAVCCIELIDIGKQVQRPYDTLYECPGHLAHPRPCTLMVNLYMVNLYREMPDSFGKPFVGRSYILKFPKELKRGSWVELVCPQTGTNLNKTIAKLIKEQQMLQKNAVHDAKKNQNASVDEKKYKMPVQNASVDEKKYKMPQLNASFDEKMYKMPVQSATFDEKSYKMPELNASFDKKKYKVPQLNASFDEKKCKMPELNASFDEKKHKVTVPIRFDEMMSFLSMGCFDGKYMPKQNASFDEKKKGPGEKSPFEKKEKKLSSQNISNSDKMTFEPGKSLKSFQNGIKDEGVKLDSAQSTKSLQNDENVEPDKLPSMKSMEFPEDGPAFLNGVVRYETIVLGTHDRVHK